MGKQSEESRHYSQIWARVIQEVLHIVKSECDEEFSQKCLLQTKSIPMWKHSLELEYRKLRGNLKEICYGEDGDTGILDGRKFAAIFCNAFIKNKVFCFDTKAANELVEKQKKALDPVKFNLWAVHNVFLNYKFAYYVSLQLVYLTLMDQLLSAEKTKEAIKLNKIGHLLRYLDPISDKADSFDVNMIIGLARADLDGKELDMFLFAMQLYQIEMYTVKSLQCE